MSAIDIGEKVNNRQQRRNKLQNRSGERGFVLLVMGVTAVVVAGCLGLAMDVGKTYITKNEAQAFADAGALAAALKLDGTSAGVTNAQTAATSLGNKWNFASTAFSGTTVDVATSSAGPWTSASSPPSPATNYTYVRVTASASVNLYFTPVITAWWGATVMNETVRASAIAAQLPQTTWNTGALRTTPTRFTRPLSRGVILVRTSSPVFRLARTTDSI
jgi:uncharacterized membrane protein